MRLSLQKKFILIGFASVLLLTASIGYMAAVKTRDALYKASDKQGRMLAQTVSAVIINELIYEMLGLVEEGGLIDNYMRDLHNHPELDLNFIAVLDNTRKVISHSDFSEYGKRYEEPFIEKSLQQEEVTLRKTMDIPHSTYSLEVAAPLSIEGKRWGILYFSMSLQSVEQEISALIQLIVSISVIALIVLFILIYFLSRRFIKPIIDMSHAMAEVEVEMSEKAIPVFGSDELSRLTENFNDMVRRIRNANEEMKVAHEKLLQSEKLATLGVLSSSVAHRINNPLGGLFNCVTMLRRKGDEKEFRGEYLDLIEEGLVSIKRTVSQLLKTVGRDKAEEQRSDIHDVLANVMRFLDYKIKNQNITFLADIEPGLETPLAPHDLEEIFLNTMINSIQAMPEGGYLRVAARRGNKKVHLIVEDNGAGIAKADLEKVFDLFYSTKGRGEGTGVGMWMTYELIKKYNGDLSLESEEGSGTTISFIIPEAG